MMPANSILASFGCVDGVEVGVGPNRLDSHLREVVLNMKLETIQGRAEASIHLILTQEALEELVRALRRVKNVERKSA